MALSPLVSVKNSIKHISKLRNTYVTASVLSQCYDSISNTIFSSNWLIQKGKTKEGREEEGGGNVWWKLIVTCKDFYYRLEYCCQMLRGKRQGLSVKSFIGPTASFGELLDKLSASNAFPQMIQSLSNSSSQL